MSDEDDYMSSAFLDVKEDIRPGLVHSSRVKRKYEIEKKEKESRKLHRTKSRKELEEESRNVGLNVALGSDNKGFALLQKMGYKPGMKLGPRNDTTSNAGLIEPIKVTVKSDRGGLGRDQEIRKRIEQREKRKREMKVYKEQETEALTRDFRDRMRYASMNRRSLQELKRCQQTCEQLDRAGEVHEPLQPWFWFTRQTENEEEEEWEDKEEDEEGDEEELSAEEKVEFVVEYMRPKYLYCFWCGVQYDSEEDMEQNCPGPDRDCHDDTLS